MKNYVVVLLILSCLACKQAGQQKTQKQRLDQSGLPVKHRQQSAAAVSKQSLLGAWSNGTSSNANFFIHPDSIYYEDNNERCKYTLTGDSICIYFSDGVYRGKLYFKGDTLVMANKEDGVAKFWRFKN